MKSITISKDKSKLDIDLIHLFLKDAYWSKGRTRETIIKSIENSICFGVFLGSQQIGFARVATDKSVFAYLMDVFILPEYRGNDYGQQLINMILTDEELNGIERWMLATSKAHGLYTKFGFGPIDDPTKLMCKFAKSKP